MADLTPVGPEAFRISTLGTTDLSCPYCGASGTRLRKKAFNCPSCSQTVRPRDRHREYGARYYTQADWFLVDATRSGELTPDIVRASLIAHGPWYSWSEDDSVISQIEAAIECVAADIARQLGRPTSSTDLLKGYFATRLRVGADDARSGFDRYRHAEFLSLIGMADEAREHIDRTIIWSALNPFDPLVAPGWIRLHEKLHNEEFTCRTAERLARSAGIDVAAGAIWRAVQQQRPTVRARLDFSSQPYTYRLRCEACQSFLSENHTEADDSASCSSCGVELGASRVLSMFAEKVAATSSRSQISQSVHFPH